ncbi:MAG: hypothetical protein AAB701_02905 [Patescibacteria group bacterium]
MIDQRKPIIIGFTITAVVLAAGFMAYRSMQPTPVVVPGGSISIELDSVDQQFLEQIKEIPSPQSTNPAYGGSGIEQSPQYDVDTWHQLLDGELE